MSLIQRFFPWGFDVQAFVDQLKSNLSPVKVEKIKEKLLYHFYGKLNISTQSTSPWAIQLREVLSNAIDYAIEEIKRGSITSEKDLTKLVFKSIDAYLFSLLSSVDGRQRDAAEKIYLDWFKPYVNHADVKKLLRKEEDRINALVMAYVKSLIKVRNKTFRGESSLFTYFFSIFKGECVDMIRASLKRPSDVLMGPLDGDVQAMIQIHPPSINSKDLEWLSSKYPECFNLIKRKSEGFSYEELAVMFQVTFQSIKHKIEHCRKQLQDAWNADNQL